MRSGLALIFALAPLVTGCLAEDPARGVPVVELGYFLDRIERLDGSQYDAWAEIPPYHDCPPGFVVNETARAISLESSYHQRLDRDPDAVVVKAERTPWRPDHDPTLLPAYELPFELRFPSWSGGRNVTLRIEASGVLLDGIALAPNGTASVPFAFEASEPGSPTLRLEGSFTARHLGEWTAPFVLGERRDCE